MHVVFRESHGLEETETPQDLGQTPGELVVLSFSDSDLSAFAEDDVHQAGATSGTSTERIAAGSTSSCSAITTKRPAGKTPGAHGRSY